MTFQRLPKNKIIQSVVVIVVCISIGSWIPRQLTLSPTDSLAEHLFILDRDIDVNKIRRGNIVRFRFNDTVVTKAAERLGVRDAYLLKRVACIEGQNLSVRNKEYYCDGAYLGAAKAAPEIVNFIWNGTVPPGKFFAMSDHINSYDSRYFGFVDLARVEARAFPVF